MSIERVQAVTMQFNGHSLLLFFFTLFLLQSEDEHVRSSPVSSLHVHSFNVDLELVDGEGTWMFKEVWGLSYLYQSSDGFITLGCFGECRIRGQIPKFQELHLHHFYGDLYVDSLDAIHAEVIGGDAALYNVKISDIRQSSGDIELILPPEAKSMVIKSRGDVSIYRSMNQSTEVVSQNRKVLHLIEGEDEIFIQSNEGEILWNGQDSYVDNLVY